jgi:RNA polymerase-binding transcription factor DksA
MPVESRPRMSLKDPVARKKWQQEYYRKNTEAVKRRISEWRELHKDAVNANTRKYRKENRAKITKQNLEYHKKIRRKFIEMYGGVCACCGETIYEFLTIEHKQGQRGAAKKEFAYPAYLKAVREYRPDVYEVLCMNCNHAKSRLGVCPHKERGES